MSDNLRRYRAIRDALTQCYPGQPSGTVARHLITLAALISGIVGSKSTQLPHIAAKVPNGTNPKAASNALRGGSTTPTSWRRCTFALCGRLVAHLALQTVVLVMDGSGVGRGCTALMIHVVYKGRALRWPGGYAKPRRALSRRTPYRLGRPSSASDPSRGAGGVAGRWRIRWDALQQRAAGGLVLRVSHGHKHRGDVGGRDLPP